MASRPLSCGPLGVACIYLSLRPGRFRSREESRDGDGGKLRFIKVKGRSAGATSVAVTSNEILTALNKPDDYVLAVMEVDGETASKPRYVNRPFSAEPDFRATSASYDLRRMPDAVKVQRRTVR